MRLLIVLMFLVTTPALARDDGRYANSPLREWFNGLSSEGGGSCCSNADGLSLKDVDWDIKEGHYRVRIESIWYDVPDKNVVKGPNRLGPAVVWPIKDAVGNVKIRCFLPGAMG